MPRFLAYVLDHLLNSFIVLFIFNLESETFTLFQYPSPQQCCLQYVFVSILVVLLGS